MLFEGVDPEVIKPRASFPLHSEDRDLILLRRRHSLFSILVNPVVIADMSSPIASLSRTRGLVSFPFYPRGKTKACFQLNTDAGNSSESL